MFNIENELDKDFSQTPWGKVLLEEINEELIDDIAILTDSIDGLEYEKDLDEFKQTIESDIKQLTILQENLNNWDKSYEIAQNIKFITWPRKKVESEIKDEIKKIRDNVKKKFNKKLEKIFVSDSKQSNQDIFDMYDILKKLKNLIIEFDEIFSKKKRDKNIVDFTDIEHFALNILVKGVEKTTDKNGLAYEKIVKTDVAKKYTEKFEEIAIDEYQDSNLVQEFILSSISRGNNMFMVGDVKQSIYRFRQAMPKLFLEKYSNYETVGTASNDINGRKIQLFKNFRSRDNVLDFTNLIFKNIMSEKLGEVDYNEDEYLNFGAEDYKKINQSLRTEIDIIDLKKEENLDIENTEYLENDNDTEELEHLENIEIEAKYVANKIKKLIDSKYQVYDRKKENFRDITYKDIAILLRSTKDKASIYEQELIKLDMPVFSDSNQEYLDSIEIQTIMSLLKIIDNPMQDIPLVTVLRSNIGKFTDNELVEIRLSDKYDNFYNCMQKAKVDVNSQLKEKIEHFLNQIETWRKEQEYLALDELIWKIYSDTGYYNYVGLMPNGNLRQANLKMLFERAKKYETASFKGLYNFINFIEKLKINSGDLSSAKIIGENDDVIRIMSIHKSKGLEFPVVFLVNTNKQFNEQDIKKNPVLLHQELGIGAKYINYNAQVQYDTLTREAIKNVIRNENISEEMRILYVALTRAKEKLIITGYSTTDKQNGLHDICDKYSELNSILLKKCKTYLDWMELVYIYNQDEMKELSNINVYTKKEVLKMCKTEEVEKENTEKQILDKISKVKIDDEEKKKISKILEYKYKYQDSTIIPTKTSVTELKIAPKKSDLKCAKFLKEDTETKITNAQKGTLIHLCMQKLDTQNKNYTYSQIKDLVQDLENKKIITHKEAEAININKVYQFTKSKIWEEMIHAHAVHREKAFYISIPAKEVFDKELEEKILVQGVIDLYYINEQNELILVDYKTDYVEDRNEQILVDKYNIQLELYKRALEDALQRKVDKVYIYSTYLEKEILI